jgi:antitoxin PrlF
MIHSRLTSKSQTTIPRAVRDALGVGPGDDLAYLLEGGRVTLASRSGAQSDNNQPERAAHDPATIRAAIERMRRRARSLPGGPLTIGEIVDLVREGRR